MNLGNAALLDTDIAQIVLSSDQGHVADNLDWTSTTFDRNQMRSHELPFCDSLTTHPENTCETTDVSTITSDNAAGQIQWNSSDHAFIWPKTSTDFHR